MPDKLPIFRPTIELADDPEYGDLRRGRRPVIFDVVKSDRETSLLPEGLRLVMHVNPSTMQLSYAKQTERTQTRGGFVEFHWGDAAEEITFDAATGGFMRLYAGLSNITGGSGTQGRRETLAYNKYLDMLALFHNNGAIYDSFGNIVIQGYIKMTFDGAVHVGWFDSGFSVTEDANTPFMFRMSGKFIIDQEIMRWRSSDLGLRSDRVGAAPLSTFDAQAITLQDITQAGPRPSDELLDPFAARLPTNPNFDASQPANGLRDPFASAPATTILEEEFDPFADPLQGTEIAPGVFLPPGSTTLFPVVPQEEDI